MIILTLLELLNQLRVLHWQTNNYNHHGIFGDLYSSLSDSTDTLLEVGFGQGMDKTFSGERGEIILQEISELNVVTYFEDYIASLYEIKEQMPTLTNIVDSMVDELNKAKFLLSLK